MTATPMELNASPLASGSRKASFFRRSAAAWALAAAAAFGFAGPASAESDGEQIYKDLIRSTVWVIAGSTTGTGSLVDAERKLVVTNHHVVGDNATVDVLFPVLKNGRVVAERPFYLKNGNRIRGRVVAKDGKRDLAVIRLESVPKDTPALALAKDSATPGAKVHSIGNPSVSGALWVYTSGAVRQVYRRQFRLKDGREIDARVVETQSPINSGDSGGPVVNDKGELVAVVQSYEGNDARLVSTFIDVTEVKAVLGGELKAVAETPATAASPTEAVFAKVDNVRQEHNVERDGKKGVLLHVQFEVRNAKGVAGELVAIFHDRASTPLKAKQRAFSNAAGELCAFQRIVPGYEQTAYKDVELFLPYEELTTSPGKNELRFSVNVWCDRRWVVEKPYWGGFLITNGE